MGENEDEVILGFLSHGDNMTVVESNWGINCLDVPCQVNHFLILHGLLGLIHLAVDSDSRCVRDVSVRVASERLLVAVAASTREPSNR
jgi:hypothetical protein